MQRREEQSWLRGSWPECGEDLVRLIKTRIAGVMLMASRLWYSEKDYDIFQERGEQERLVGQEGSSGIYL